MGLSAAVAAAPNAATALTVSRGFSVASASGKFFASRYARPRYSFARGTDPLLGYFERKAVSSVIAFAYSFLMNCTTPRLYCACSL